MKDKMDKIVNRGAGVFRVIMKSRPVSIGCFLFTGILHFIDPRGGLRWTVWMLTGSVAVYALISLVFVLTDNNQTVGKGKKAAGVSFILMSWSTAELVMRISGLILIGRAIVELVIMIRNREAFLPAEAATTEIKQQGE